MELDPHGFNRGERRQSNQTQGNRFNGLEEVYLLPSEDEAEGNLRSTLSWRFRTAEAVSGCLLSLLRPTTKVVGIHTDLPKVICLFLA